MKAYLNLKYFYGVKLKQYTTPAAGYKTIEYISLGDLDVPLEKGDNYERNKIIYIERGKDNTYQLAGDNETEQVKKKFKKMV